MNKDPITVAIRNALIDYGDRNAQLEAIMSEVDCDRYKAKELYYAFLYRADEAYLVHILQRGSIETEEFENDK